MLAELFGPGTRLSAVESLLDLLHHTPSVTAKRLEELMNRHDPDALLLFDVREPEEFDTSHLQGAIRIDPAISPEAFAQLLPQTPEGSTVVAYCSVGERSAVLLQRVRNILEERGMTSILNLRGGIFRWYNDGRMVVDEHGPTDRIHPYDAIWGTLIEARSSGK